MEHGGGVFRENPRNLMFLGLGSYDLRNLLDFGEDKTSKFYIPGRFKRQKIQAWKKFFGCISSGLPGEATMSGRLFFWKDIFACLKNFAIPKATLQKLVSSYLFDWKFMETCLNPDLHHFISLVNGGFGTKLQKDRDTTRANHSAVLWRWFFCRVNAPGVSPRPIRWGPIGCRGAVWKPSYWVEWPHSYWGMRRGNGKKVQGRSSCNPVQINAYLCFLSSNGRNVFQGQFLVSF